MLRHLFIASLIFSLFGCGFQLKGESRLPDNLQQINLSLSEDDDFNNSLIKQLKSSGAFIVQSKQAAFLSVRLDKLPELIVAQSSSTGLQIERLKINVEYSVRDAQGQWLVQQKTIVQSRDFEADSNQLLAKNNEKIKLYTQMKQNLARMMIYQLQLLK